MSKNNNTLPAIMANSSQAGGPVTEAQYELPNFSESVEAIIRNKRESVQDTLEALASHGYYLVKRRSNA